MEKAVEVLRWGTQTEVEHQERMTSMSTEQAVWMAPEQEFSCYPEVEMRPGKVADYRYPSLS